MNIQKAVNPQEVLTEVPDPMTICANPVPCAHRRYWHGDGISGKCTRAGCPCEDMVEPE